MFSLYEEEENEVQNEFHAQDITEIVFLLDVSGSMGVVRDQTVASVNDFILKQREVNGQAIFTIGFFNDSYEKMEGPVDIQDCSMLSTHWAQTDDTIVYSPDGMTALRDAIVVQTHETNNRISQLPESQQPSKVIFVVLTDGLDNSSHYTVEEVKALIDSQEEMLGWDYLYLGADQDAYEIGKSLGIKPGKSMAFKHDNKGLKALSHSLAESVVRYRVSGSPENDQFFTEEDFKAQQELGAPPTGPSEGAV